MKFRILLTAGLFVVLAVTAAFGQQPAVKAQISFPFTVGGKLLPAGTYDFVKDEVAGVFKVSDEKKNEAAAPIHTRLAASAHAVPSNTLVVFDKLGETYVLAEIWIPGEDGYVLALTKAKHEHMVVKGKL